MYAIQFALLIQLVAAGAVSQTPGNSQLGPTITMANKI